MKFAETTAPRRSTHAAALYVRVSTTDQNTAAQLEALRQYAAARGWGAVEYVDHGVSGAKERRPALDALLSAARRREVAVVVVTKLDRLARSLHQLVALEREFAITESGRFQIRGEFFNAMNHVNLGTPNRFVNTPQFGTITDAATPGREVQVSARLSF